MLSPNSCEDGVMQVLFAGGCHVVGYPIGEMVAFPEVVRQCLQVRGVVLDTHRLAYIKLTHAAKLRAACAESRPDLLVLQLGHFELSRPLSQYLRSRLRPPRASSAKSGSEPSANPILRPRLFRVVAEIKKVIDWALGQPLVDFTRFEAQLDDFLSETEQWSPQDVILLSPLPCADTLSMRYRRRAAAIMQRQAARHGIQFLDLLSAHPGWSFGAEGNFYDAIHLGARGHLHVGSAIANRILASLPRKAGQAILR
ncbi:MAG: SGNH/GDSL hydrolase family protein [Bryobacterales bacterium]|nr:SGNH/GDSL hydrolase family protein [Bryobacterales bacterium]